MIQPAEALRLAIERGYQHQHGKGPRFSGPSISGARRAPASLQTSGMAASAGMCVEAGDDGTMRGLSSAIHQADAIQHFGERRGWRKVRVET